MLSGPGGLLQVFLHVDRTLKFSLPKLVGTLLCHFLFLCLLPGFPDVGYRGISCFLLNFLVRPTI